MFFPTIKYPKQHIIDVIKDRCIKYGDFTLSSGQKSNWICDLMEARDYFPYMMQFFKYDFGMNREIFGIETGGAFLTYSIEPRCGIIRKNGDVYLPWPKGNKNYTPPVILVDDVCTTERSFKNSIADLDKLEIEVVDYFCILDRRDSFTLPIKSLIAKKELGLN